MTTSPGRGVPPFRHRLYRPAVLGAALVLTTVTACTAGPAATTRSLDCDTSVADAAIASYVSGGVLASGPYGETSASADEVTLTDEEVTRVREMGATAAIVMHFSGDSWSTAQVQALRSELDRLGIAVVAQTDAQADPAKQFSDVETALAADPDVMISIPSLDVGALAPAYRAAVDAGVRLVFMENPALDFRPGTDYVSVVATDNYGAGVLGAHQMARALCGQGEVGVLHQAAQAPTNVLRERGFVETLERDYPDIAVVENEGLLGPDWKGEGDANVNAWLLRHPQLRGVWCWFDAPCEGAVDAARTSGRDLAVTTVDLGTSVAVEMAREGHVSGIAAAQPYAQGTIEARLAAYALLGKPAPPFVALPARAVDRDSLLAGWQDVYRAAPPVELTQALGGR